MEPLNLCSGCSGPASGIFTRSYSRKLTDLELSRNSCGLCGILSEHFAHSGTANHETARVFRVGSSLARSMTGSPVFSILVGPGKYSYCVILTPKLTLSLTIGFTRAPADIQRGFPKLPECGSKTQVRLLREWIRDCNRSHRCRPKGNIRLPTRLIDVGDSKLPICLKLDCKAQRASNDYVALSHRWGDEKLHKRFCTYRDNVDQFQNFINYTKLPKTFQDAVTVTRSLGIRYLWIDSLCVIQEDKEDWEAECQRMEDVFSSAYCTIAASCASGTTDGFLKPLSGDRSKNRRCYALNGEVESTDKNSVGDSVFYICDAIDNFARDVEKGQLSKRGWVFQERALSRRTIHFTETQVYWECGKGIRCETLTKMFK
jgi:hypothetical protein